MNIPSIEAFEIKEKFEDVIGRSIYELLPGVEETTFL